MYIDPPKSNFEPAPEVTHLAILIRLIDLGLQENSYQGRDTVQHQAMLTFETPLKLDSKGRPYLVTKTMNLSLHEKATFRAWAQDMIGRPFTKDDLDGSNRFNAKDLLGKTCLLKIEHTEKEGKVYVKIVNLMQTPEGMPEPHQVNDETFFSLEPGEFNEKVFEGLSAWAKEKIEGSENGEALAKARQAPLPPPVMATAAIGRSSPPTKPVSRLSEIVDDEIPF
jgi:hypothetical protein